MNDQHRIVPLPPDLEAELASFGSEDQAALLEAWILAGDAPASDPPGKQAVWSAVRPVSVIRPMSVRPPLRLFVTRSLAVAASILALVAVATILQPWNIRHEGAPGVAFTSVDLPDGSTVRLAPGTKLTHSRWFGDDVRHVDLEGEAFFDVAHDGTPFVVETFSAHVEVLGTVFNVRAWSTDRSASTKIDLESGSVRVSGIDRPEVAVRLAPGETTRVPQDAVPEAPAPGDVSRASNWLSGGMAFSNAPIGDVLDELARRFNVRIQAPEDIRLGTVSFFRHTSASMEDLLGDLADTAGLKYRRTAQGFEVFVP